MCKNTEFSMIQEIQIIKKIFLKERIDTTPNKTEVVTSILDCIKQFSKSDDDLCWDERL